MKKMTILLVLVALITSVNAQNCDYCNAALAKDTRDEYESVKKSSYESALKTLFSYDYDFWSNYSSSTNKTQDLDAGFGLFDIIDFDGSSSSTYSRQELKQKFEKIRTYYSTSQSIASDDYTWISKKTASKAVYDAWVECIKSCPYNQKGITLNFSGDDQEFFIMTLEWIPADGSGTQVKVTSIVPTNAELIDEGELKQDAVLRPFNSLSRKFRRQDINRDVTIVINTDNAGAKAIKIPKYSKPELPIIPEVPIGTIVASVFDYETFSYLNSQPPLFDIKKSKWAPADGRGVVGSAFGRIQNSVPDLRGLFLRGLNQFYKNGQGAPQLNSNQADPENRNPGQFQKDELVSHGHTVGPLPVGHTNGGNGHPHRLTSEDGPSWNNTSFTQSANPTGGAETRPKNAAVFYYIRIN
jgi:hypothetical protein